jgi:hypothetical protein
MEIAALIGTATLATLGTELVVTSLVKKCVITKLVSVSDGFAEVLWQMTKLGFGHSSSSSSTPTVLLKTKLINGEENKEFKSLRESIQNRQSFQELNQMNLFGQICLITAMIQDIEKQNEKKMIIPNTAEPSKDLSLHVLYDYKPKSQQVVEKCNCKYCESNTFCQSVGLLKSVCKRIQDCLLQIEKENIRYQKSWGWISLSYLDDEFYFQELKMLTPILKECKDDLIKILPLVELMKQIHNP